MLHSVQDPTGRPYESAANVLNAWSYGRPASAMDKGFGLLEVADPSMWPVLLSGGAEHYRKNRE